MHQEVAKSCKVCGGNPFVEEQRPLEESMLSTVGLELSRVIDPHLNWKTTSKGKPRAIRRARSSFSGVNKKKPTAKSSKDSDDLTAKNPKGEGEMPVSESEKLGVTILGRRFSDTFENVPIKKRRFLLVRSPSPPPRSPSPLSTDPEHINAKQQVREIKTCISTGVDKDRVVADEKTNLEEINEKHFDSADFSGISILAAAACNSSVGGDGINAEREESIRILGRNVSHTVPDDKTEEQSLRTVEISDEKVDVSLEKMNTSMFSDKDQDGNEMEGSHFPASTSLLHSVPEKVNGTLGRVESSSRDDRLNWDLNTVMDIWESPCDSQPLAVSGSTSDGNCNGKTDKLGPWQGEMELGETNCAKELMDSKVVLGSVPMGSCVRLNLEVEVKPDYQCNTSVADRKNEKDHRVSVSQSDDLVQAELQLNNVTVTKVDFVEGIKAFSSQEQSSLGAEALSSPVGHAVDVVGGCSISDANMSEKERVDAHCVSFGSVLETVNTSSQLDLSGNTCNRHTIHACEPDPAVDLKTSEAVFVENKNAASISDLDSRSCDCHLADLQRGEIICVKIPQSDEHASLDNDPEPSKINNCSVFAPVAEQVSDQLGDTNNCQKVTVDAKTGVEVKMIEPYDEAVGNVKDQTKEADKSSCPSDSHAFITQGSSNCKEFSSASGTMGNVDMAAGETKAQGNGCSLLAAENLNAPKTDYHHVHTVSKDSAHDVIGMAPGTVDRVNNAGEDALEDLFDCGYESDISQNDTDQATGMEKVELLEDDDSQYEDGEFRESSVHFWGVDGDEEGETEHVDYGSDNRDTDVFEAACGFPTSTISLHVDSVDYNNERSLEDGHVHYGKDQVVEKDVQEAVYQAAQQGSSITYLSHIGTGRKSTVSVVKKFSRGDYRRKGDSEIFAEGDGVRESSHSASLRIKSSGWDQLPEGSKSSGDIDTGVESAKRNHNGVCLDAFNAGESLRRADSSTVRRDLSSRIERPKSSDLSSSKNRSYTRGSRSDDPNDSNLSVERDAGPSKSIGRGGSSHMHGRGRGGDRWVESSNHWRRSRRDSPGYYGPTGYTQPGSKNAAAAAAAKVESNGFLVAPDGTVVEAGGLGPAGRVPRRSANASLQSSHPSLVRRGSPSERDEELTFGKQLGLGPMREISPDRRVSLGRGRPGRYGARMISTGHRERYRGPMPDDGVGSSISMHHPSFRRDRGFSPHRRPLRMSRSRSKSPSRSRTRSPHMWNSPRGRSDSGMNGGPGLRRRRRTTPNYRSDGRVERMRSPHRRPGFTERMSGFVPSSRDHSSPPHASRWIDERKDLADHFTEHEYKRSSGRSPPVRFFSRSQRFDLMDSTGRMKQEEHYRPIRSGRFPEFVGVGRGHGIDGGDDDRRGHGDRYEMLPSVRQYDIVDDMKQFRYDIDDGFRTHDSRAKNAPEFHGRGSPRGFDRGIDNQMGNSPRRAREEKGPYRYSREGKHSGEFKSFGMRECDEDLAARRRRPS